MFDHPRSILETERLRLRPLQPDDEEFLTQLDCDAAVMRYIHAGPMLPESARKWAKMQIETAPHRSHLQKWMVERAGDRIGWVELGKFRGIYDPEEARVSDDISIGYQFATAYWRQGFALEAARGLLHYAFDTLQFDRVIAFVHLDNQRSTRLLEKLGFRQHPTRRHVDDAGHTCFLSVLWKKEFLLR